MGSGTFNMVEPHLSQSALVFPGQGSQSLGMLSLYGHHPVIVSVVEEVSEVVKTDLKKIIEEDNEAINQTTHTQAIMLAMGVGVYRALGEISPLSPLCMAGHSLGEYSALVCAGVLSLSDAARLVKLRAHYMQTAVEGGGMMAILGLPVEAVETVCETINENGSIVWIANYNSEKQIVIAGLSSSLSEAAPLFKQAGAKRTVLLPMSVPSHCPLLQSAADQLFLALTEIVWHPSSIPVFHTATFPHQAENDFESADYYARLMSAQLTQRIDWPNILRKIESMGAVQILECGPGKVLTSLGKASKIPHYAINNEAEILQWSQQ